MHSCQNGFCRFCGPKSCRSNLDCCGGSFASAGQAGKFYECLNIEETEKLALAQQLGRVPQGFKPLAKVQGGKSPEDQLGVESEELLQLGPSAQGDVAMYGKRCWARKYYKCLSPQRISYLIVPAKLRSVSKLKMGTAEAR